MDNTGIENLHDSGLLVICQCKPLCTAPDAYPATAQAHH